MNNDKCDAAWQKFRKDNADVHGDIAIFPDSLKSPDYFKEGYEAAKAEDAVMLQAAKLTIDEMAKKLGITSDFLEEHKENAK